MAYSYGDWVTYPETTAAQAAAKLARLRLHIQEVDDRVTATVGAEGRNRDATPLNAKLDRLYQHEQRLQRKAGGSVELARINRG